MCSAATAQTLKRRAPRRSRTRRTEAPQAHRDVELERARRMAPMPEQVLDGGQALPHGVDVDVEPLRRRLGVLVAVEIREQRRGELRAALAVVRQQRTDRGLEEVGEARPVVRLEQRRVDRQLVLADDLRCTPMRPSTASARRSMAYSGGISVGALRRVARPRRGRRRGAPGASTSRWPGARRPPRWRCTGRRARRRRRRSARRAAA